MNVSEDKFYNSGLFFKHFYIDKILQGDRITFT